MEKPGKIRLDELVVNRGFAPSRSQAQIFIKMGRIFSGERIMDKAGTMVPDNIELRMVEKPRYLSRGGFKLEGALKRFNLDVTDMVCLDVGASTGGFTDCLLQHGAKRVYALDVNSTILHERLQGDSKVVSIEANARYINSETLPELVDLVTVDISFISVRKVIQAILSILKPGGMLLILVKPQFELSRSEVSRGRGVIRDSKMVDRAVDEILTYLRGLKLQFTGRTPSPVKGPKGNQEHFLLMKSER